MPATTRNQWKKLNNISNQNPEDSTNKITPSAKTNEKVLTNLNSQQQSVDSEIIIESTTGDMMMNLDFQSFEFEPAFNTQATAGSFFNDQQVAIGGGDCFGIAAAPAVANTIQQQPLYQLNNNGKQMISCGFNNAKDLLDLLQDSSVTVSLTEKARNDGMNLLSQAFGVATAANASAFVLSPPQTPRSRSDSFEGRAVPVASPIGYGSDGELSYPSSPVQQQQYEQPLYQQSQQDMPLEIFDQLIGTIGAQQQQQQPIHSQASDAKLLITSQEYELQDLLSQFDTDFELMPTQASTPAETLVAAQWPVFSSQESFSSQALTQQQKAAEAERQRKQQEQDKYEADMLAQAVAEIEPQPLTQENDYVSFDGQGISLADIDEILSNASGSSPQPSQVGDDAHTLPASSPSHSMTSAFDLSDPDFEPMPVKKSNRGRKRKSIDSDLSEREEAKKLKNAAAAARYREKQKHQNQQFDKELSKVEAEHNDLAKRFNAKLTERNFMLKLVYEAHKKDINGLGSRRFPAWVEAWFKQQKD